MTRKKGCWCYIRRVKSGRAQGTIGDMVCSTSKRAVRKMAREVVREGYHPDWTKPKITRAPLSNCESG